MFHCWSDFYAVTGLCIGTSWLMNVYKVPQWKAISNLNSRLYHLSVSVTDVFLVPCYVFYNATAKHGWK